MVLFFLGCFTVVSDELGNRYPERPFHDFDGDGLVDEEDCDDSNIDIGARQTYYYDEDRDGFPDGAVSDIFCPQEKPAGYIFPPERNGVSVFDCDDQDAGLTPEDFDQDGTSSCDGDCDDRNSTILGTNTYYFDADGDGFGDESISEVACPAEKSDGYIAVVERSGVFLFDCDDQDVGLTPEDFDQDGTSSCDGDCDDRNSTILGPNTYYFDADGDGFPDESISEVACPAEKSDGYLLPQQQNGREVFDCDDQDLTLTPEDFDLDGTSSCEGDCDDRNSSVLQPEMYYRDADGDGFGLETDSVLICPNQKPSGYIPAKIRNTELVFDCDDSVATIHPDAIEICDQLDNDCNSQVDEYIGPNAPRWYLDSDGDGFGDFNQVTLACLPPLGYVDNFSDCDDSDALIHVYVEGLAGGIEFCDADGKDENCNGIVNEDSAADATRWYEDADGDGFGAEFVYRDACEQPEGFLASSGDCNDSNADIYPYAVESCNGLDDDCDASIDEGVDELAPIGSTVFYADSDGDGFGDPTYSRTQCTQPVGFVSDGTDCNDNTDQINPNSAEYCNGIDDDCDGFIDEEDAQDKVAFYADQDGDSYGSAVDLAYACQLSQLEGYVAIAGDCNDDNEDIHPDATEVCDELDNNCDGLSDDADANLDLNTASIFYEDADFDGFGDPLKHVYRCEQPAGFSINDSDCDDSSALRNPNGVEYCNNIDDDCDTLIDNSAIDSVDYYRDADGDGHGSLVDTGTGFDLNACPVFDEITNQPLPQEGYSIYNNDCDDSALDTNQDGIIDGLVRSPSNPELCTNDIDENCDTHNTAGATDVSTFIVDADKDGFGSDFLDAFGELAYTLDLCIQPSGYILYEAGDALDCSDLDFEVHPSGAIEHTHDIIENGVVIDSITHTHTEKINGKVDLCENDWNGDLTPPDDEWDHDGDGYVEGTLDPSFLYNPDGTVNAWEGPQVIFGGGDCDDVDILTYPEADELCNGVFENCTAADYVEGGSPYLESDDDGDGYVECDDYDQLTWEAGPITGGGDCNDNFPELYPRIHPDTQLLTCFADLTGDGYPDRGWDYCDPVRSISSAEYSFVEDAIRNYTGNAVAPAGDVDGDGLADLLISAVGSDVGGTDSGKVFLVLGSSLGPNSEIDLSLADYSFAGEAAGDALGFSVSSAGDIDEDGLDDILIGAPRNDEAGGDAGKVYLFLGETLLTMSGAIDLSLADYSFMGEAEGDFLGASVSSAGDVDGDGLADILIGAKNADDGLTTQVGKTYLFFGSSLDVAGPVDASSADYVFIGINATSRSGSSVSSAGDVDGDGLADILIGAPSGSSRGFTSGEAYLVFASSLGAIPEISLSTADHRFEAESVVENLGVAVSSAGDVDGDGLADILLGANGNDDGGTDAGKVYLFLGTTLDTAASVINGSEADVIFVGEEGGDAVGESLSQPGDADGDGLADILIGSSGNEEAGTRAGKVYLFLSADGWTDSLVDLSLADYAFTGLAGDGFGSAITFAGDLNGDGLDELLIGAEENSDGGIGVGKAALIFACE